MIAGPDSRAQLAIQAAERLRTLGVGVPWQVTPPLPPALIAALSAIGLSPAEAYVLLVVVAFLACAAAVFVLCRRMGAAPWLALAAAGLTLVAPSGILAVWERGEIDRLLFWKLVPLVFLAIDRFRRKPSALSIALILTALAAMVLTRNTRFIGFDLLALVEWIRSSRSCSWRERMPATPARRWGCVLRRHLLRAPSSRLRPRRARAHARRSGRSAPRRRPRLARRPLPAGAEQALGLIRLTCVPTSRCLAASSARNRHCALHGVVAECIERQGDWCAFSVGPAPRAVLVSRERFETLQPIRGLFDVDGLNRYLIWAMRPEAVGFEQQGSRIRVHGEAGPDDVVLIRVNAAE
ncbi:MAG: 6-pyruvoyl-tetrahydropterin synthase-related protein [Bryobacterales bacterium]